MHADSFIEAAAGPVKRVKARSIKSPRSKHSDAVGRGDMHNLKPSSVIFHSVNSDADTDAKEWKDEKRNKKRKLLKRNRDSDAPILLKKPSRRNKSPLTSRNMQRMRIKSKLNSPRMSSPGATADIHMRLLSGRGRRRGEQKRQDTESESDTDTDRRMSAAGGDNSVSDRNSSGSSGMSPSSSSSRAGLDSSLSLPLPLLLKKKVSTRAFSSFATLYLSRWVNSLDFGDRRVLWGSRLVFALYVAVSYASSALMARSLKSSLQRTSISANEAASGPMHARKHR